MRADDPNFVLATARERVPRKEDLQPAQPKEQELAERFQCSTKQMPFVLLEQESWASEQLQVVDLLPHLQGLERGLVAQPVLGQPRNPED